MPLPRALRELHEFACFFAHRFTAVRCPQVAGSLAFTTLLSLVPLLTVGIAIFGHFPGFSGLSAALKHFLLDNLLPDKAGRIIATYALQFSEKATNLTLIGTAMLLVSAFMLLLTIEGVFNQIWRVRRPRRLLTRITVYWIALSLGPLCLGLLAFGVSYFIGLSSGLVSSVAWLREFALQQTSLVLLSGLFTLAYFALPNCPVRPKHAAIGGVLAAVLFVAMQQTFGHYAAKLPTYTLVYGTFAALPIFLAWLYMSWLVVLLGALVTASLPAFVERHHISADYAGKTAVAALHVLARVHRAHRTGRGETPATLCNASRLDNEQAERLLETLADEHWIVRDDAGAWRLAYDVEQLTLATVLRRLALSPDAIRQHDDAPLASRLATTLDAVLNSCDCDLKTLFDTLQFE